MFENQVRTSMPLVSVCCITYNHAPYLQLALESVLKQKTNFEFEIIVGDDCSTDGSQQILREYEIKYPGCMNIIYQPENSKGIKNFKDVYNAAKGKYIDVLETDDLWNDDTKLQKQVDFLESHPEVIAVAHNCNIIDAKGEIISNWNYPSIHEGYYKYRDFAKGYLPGQTTTIMYRNPKFVQGLDMSLYNSLTSGPGDLRKVFSLLTKGEIFTLPHCLSSYRHITSGSDNFSSNHKRNDLNALQYFLEFRLFSRKFSSKEMRLAADVRLLEIAIGAFKKKKISILNLYKLIRESDSPVKALMLSIYYKLRK